MSNIPQFLVGGISAGEWPKMNGKKVAMALFETKCNNCVIEAMAPAYDQSESGFNDKNLSQIYSELLKFIKPILKLDLWVTLHLTNGNDATITRFGAENICHEIIDKLIKDIGTKNIIICPVAETSNENNEQFLISYCINTWCAKGGKLIYNGSGRPLSIPANYDILDYHTQDHQDLGPSVGRTTLIDTDNSPIIRWLRGGAYDGKYWNKDRVYDFAVKCKAKGNSLNLYAYQTTSIEEDALKTMGGVYNIRNSPNWFEKLIANIKLILI